jgi:hypothetical protein
MAQSDLSQRRRKEASSMRGNEKAQWTKREWLTALALETSVACPAYLYKLKRPPSGTTTRP